MKKTKRLLTLLTALLMGATTLLGINKSTDKVNAENSIHVALPSSITSSLYRYARIIKDLPSDVDASLINWLNAVDNLSGLAFFETDPVEFTSEVNRKTKDYFYVFAYLQEYISSGCATTRNSIELIETTFNGVYPIKENLISFVDYELNDNFEDAYNECKQIYQRFLDLCTSLENDVYKIYTHTIETFIGNAKKYLEKQINTLMDVGYDASLNKYSSMLSALKGYNFITGRTTSISDESAKDLLDYILFNENTHIDTYLSNEYLDYTDVDYDNAISGITDPAEMESVSAPYLEKMKHQLVSSLIAFNFATSCINNFDTFRCIVNNYAPTLYKVLDVSYAIRDYDVPNIIYMSFLALEDFNTLLQTAGLDTNKQDLEYEKYLANMRLGSIIYDTKSPAKFNDYMLYMEKIENVSLDDFSYEEGVAEINKLVLEGYKILNVDVIPSSEQAVLFFVNGLEELASREQGYSFELRKMLNHDHAFPIESAMQSDYGDNMLYVNIIWIDMVLTDKNTNEEIMSIDKAIAATFGIYNIQIGTDLMIYRFDEANNRVVKLANEPTESETDYFDIVIDDITVHTKEFGTFAIAYINRLIKQEITDFRNDLAALQTQVNSLTAQLASKDATIAELNSKIAELEAKITSLQSDVTVKQSTINTLQGELNVVKSSLNEKLNEIENLEKIVNSKNTLNIVFIVLACVFGAVAIGFCTLYFVNKKRFKNQ